MPVAAASMSAAGHAWRWPAQVHQSSRSSVHTARPAVTEMTANLYVAAV